MKQIKNKLKKYIFLCTFFSFICPVYLFAQPTTNGTEFWASFGMNGNHPMGSDVTLKIRIVASNAANVTLTFTEDNSTVPIQVPAGGVYDYPMTTSTAVSKVYTTRFMPNPKCKKSVHISSDVPVAVYAITQTNFSTDATNLFPVSNMGKEYYHFSYMPNAGNYDGFIMIATKNNTVVNTYDDFGNPVTVNLNRGEVYADYFSNVDMTGKIHKASEPVAFFVANSAAYIPSNAGFEDNLFAQLPPINEWGLEYFVPVSKIGVERVRVIASQNGTNISRSHGTIITGTGGVSSLSNLNAGQWVELEINMANKGSIITANKPIGVCSYFVGNNYSSPYRLYSKGDPSICWIPPISQTIKNGTIAPIPSISTPPTLTEHHAIIVTKSSEKDNTIMAVGMANPTPLSGGTWYINGDYSFYNLELNDVYNSYHFANDSGLFILGYGLGNYESYYYTSGSGVRNLNPSFYINDIHYEDINGRTFCGVTNFEFKLVANLTPALGTYLRWFIDETEQTNSPNAQNEHLWSRDLSPGPHTVSLEYTDINNKKYILSTMFTVKTNTATANDIDIISPTICQGISSIDLNSLVSANGIDNPVFRWYYTESGVIHLPSTIVTPVNGTTYYVSVEGDDHCEGNANSSGRKPVTINIRPQASSNEITGPANTSVCSGLSVSLIATNSGVTNPIYKWYSTSAATTPFYTGETYITSALISDTTFYVSVSGTNFCEGNYRRTVNVKVQSGSVLWTAGANSNDWHNPNNWTPNVVPLICNTVYIPGNLDNYPELTSSAECGDIYFIYGAELGRPDLLTYNRAFVQYNFGLKKSIFTPDNAPSLVLNSSNTDKRLLFSANVSAPNMEREKWYMLSAPLKGVVTGDLGFGGFPLTFLMKFGPVNKENILYQVGNWTTPYNSMIEPVSPDIANNNINGFAFYMYGYLSGGSAERNLGCDESGIYGQFPVLDEGSYFNNRNGQSYGIENTNGVLELPFFADSTNLYAHRTQVYNDVFKTSTFFNIYDGKNDITNFNKITGNTEFITREDNNGNYRFAPETYNSTSNKWEFNNSLTHYTAGLGDTDEFLVGNPYMSSIDIVEFFKYYPNNTTLYNSFRIWNAINNDYFTYSVNTATGTVTQTNPSNPQIDMRYIAPFQGFLLKNKTTGTAQFDVDKISTVRPTGTAFNLRSNKEAKEENLLRIKAENDFSTSYTVIGYREEASNGYNPDEDVNKLFSPYNNVPSIYSLADENPVDINYINNNSDIIVPLGIKTDRTGEIRLTFTGMDNYFKASKVELFDSFENIIIDLTELSSYTYSFNNTEKGIQNGRFSIKFTSSVTSLPDIDNNDDLKVYGSSKGIYVISQEPVQKMEVYDLQGRKLYENNSDLRYFHLQNNPENSPLIIKVITRNKIKVVKVN